MEDLILKLAMSLFIASYIILMIGAVMLGIGIPFGMELINVGGLAIIIFFIIGGVWAIVNIITN